MTLCRNSSSFTSGHDVRSTRDLQKKEEWHSDLLGCGSKPSLCMCILSYKNLVNGYFNCLVFRTCLAGLEVENGPL